jgi:hypothetical protein|tara:strand:+ start:153 stop:347 length:195 start_codon:yes stop_codon:yes gene_type:complete
LFFEFFGDRRAKKVIFYTSDFGGILLNSGINVSPLVPNSKVLAKISAVWTIVHSIGDRDALSGV